MGLHAGKPVFGGYQQTTKVATGGEIVGKELDVLHNFPVGYIEDLT